MKRSRLTCLALISLFAFSACQSKGNGKGTSKSETPTSISEEPPYYELTWKDYEKHYSGYEFQNKMGTDLLLQIHNYLIDKHQTYVTYKNYWYYANSGTDLIPGTETNQLFYTNKTSPVKTHEDQDREHVWPCASSNGLWWRNSQFKQTQIDGSLDYWGGGSDLFHVRPATGSVNSKRSNASFYQFSEAELNDPAQGIRTIGDGGPNKIKVNYNASKVEVEDCYKGDVARIIAYVYTHYSSIGSKNVYYSADYKPVYSLEEAIQADSVNTPYVCGQLNLTDVVGYSTIQECHAKLKEWNRLDPPSAVEANRNNYVESIQGNRNPFIDYPQLVDYCLL